MAETVRCANPSCERLSSLGADALGRTFRCARCGTKLPRGRAENGEPSGRPPWEQEVMAGDRAGALPRALGVAKPARLGRFLVRGLLGSGSHATVYLGYDPVLEREVALKVPQQGALSGEPALSRFLSEARALARLRHPGIVPVYESGRSGDQPYLATAYIQGRTLASVIEGGPLGYVRTAEIAADLAEALGYAHDSGVVHRDVKPANVLVEPSGAVALTDFGLAHRHDAGDLTRTGVVVGTPAYLAPEQAACGDESARAESDQYSLAVVLYEMICGRPPFLGPPAFVLYSSQFDDPMPPRLLRPGVPRELERICLKAMARQASDRYPSCRDLGDALRGWLASSRASGRRSRSIDRAVTWLRRRPTAALSAALAVLGLAASAVLAVALAAPLAPIPADPSTPERTISRSLVELVEVEPG